MMWRHKFRDEFIEKNIFHTERSIEGRMFASHYYIEYLCIFIFGHKFFLWQPCHGRLNVELHSNEGQIRPSNPDHCGRPGWGPGCSAACADRWPGAGCEDDRNAVALRPCLQSGGSHCSQWSGICVVVFSVVVNGGDFLISLLSCFIKRARLRKIFGFFTKSPNPPPSDSMLPVSMSQFQFYLSVH